MSEPIKVLMVIDHLDDGGAQRLLLDLVAGVDRSRVSPIVCSLRDSVRYVEPLRAMGVSVHQLGSRFNPWKLFRLARLVRNERINVVHTHLTVSRIIGVAAARLGGARKIFSHDHSGDEYLQKHPWLVRQLLFPADRLLMRFTDRIFAVSGAIARFLCEVKGISPDKVEIVRNWINIERFAPQPHKSRCEARSRWEGGGLVVGSVGRLNEQKGYRYLIAAAPLILEKRPETIFVLAGGGPERAALEQQAESLGVASSFRFLGFVEDVEQLYAGFDLFVLPSVYEPFGLVLLEAMASGVPVIATLVGGIPEIIQDGVNGRLVAPADVPGLAGAILELAADPAQRERLLVNGRKTVAERFDRSRAIRRLEELYGAGA